MKLLDFRRYVELKRDIKNIQKTYPLGCFALEAEYQHLKRNYRAGARDVGADDLVDGKQYGILEFSPLAKAMDAKTGQWRRQHGDIYITLWTYKAEDAAHLPYFYCNTAWGGTVVKRLSQLRDELLIDIPYPSDPVQGAMSC